MNKILPADFLPIMRDKRELLVLYICISQRAIRFQCIHEFKFSCFCCTDIAEPSAFHKERGIGLIDSYHPVSL